MRAKCKNIQGGISGKMRKELERAKEIINTLIHKSEAIGDPSFLKLKNKELTMQVQNHKLNEVLKDKKIKKLHSMVNDLKKEVDELRNRLDDAEEEERKVSKKITEWKLRKLTYKDGELMDASQYGMKDKGTKTYSRKHL